MNYKKYKRKVENLKPFQKWFLWIFIFDIGHEYAEYYVIQVGTKESACLDMKYVHGADGWTQYSQLEGRKEVERRKLKKW